MSNILVINASGQETRVALIEQGTISEYYLERKNEKGIVGNIYKGRVVRVLPGMQAAFVDIGLEKAAFLYVADVVGDPTFFSEELEIQAGAVEGDRLEVPDVAEPPADAPPASESTVAAQAEAVAPTVQTMLEPPLPREDAAALAAVAAGAPEAAGQLLDRRQGVGGEPSTSTANTNPTATPTTTPNPTATPTLTANPTPTAITQPEAESVAQSETGEPPNGEDLDDEDDDEEEELDEGDAAHVAAEAALAAEEQSLRGGAAAQVSEASPATPGADPAQGLAAPAEAGQRGVPADAQRAAARERRGRRRGGRGRRRGEERGPRKPGEDRPRPEARQGQPTARDARRGDGRNGQNEYRQRAQIQDLLKEGDEVLVQVVKDPIGTKGARITCHISLPGRHLVFMPTVDHVGISRRIENEKERRRLRELVDRYRPPGTGFIVRTVAENEPSEKLTADIKFLLGLWSEVGKKRESLKAPALIHPDLDLVLRSIRDLFSDDIQKLVIDDRAEYERVRAFLEQVAPELKDSVELYTGDEPIFDEFGIEQELMRAQNRKVWLKSGGYIVIDQTEALVAIDVNSGRYTGKKGAGASLEETITRINCEAAKEIVYQLRLRNIGGIIIIDFIDMDKGSNREKVFKTLQEALGADRAKTNVLKISDIGLVEMTRKRVRESVGRLMNEVCPTCDGRGHVRSKTTVAYEIMREAQRAARKHREDQLVVSCHPEVAKLLQGPDREAMRLLMMRLNKSIVVRPQPQYHFEQYDLHGRWSRPELQQTERGRLPLRAARDAASRDGGGRREGGGGDSRERDQGKEPGRGQARAERPEQLREQPAPSTGQAAEADD